jgi:hypothetical protein
VPAVNVDRCPAIRTSVVCRVRVRGARHSGLAVGTDGVVVRISATGLYMYVTIQVSAGARLFTVVPLPSGARVAVRGYVTRVELRGDAHLGIAVRFTRTRLLPAAAQGARLAVL